MQVTLCVEQFVTIYIFIKRKDISALGCKIWKHLYTKIVHLKKFKLILKHAFSYSERYAYRVFLVFIRLPSIILSLALQLVLYSILLLFTHIYLILIVILCSCVKCWSMWLWVTLWITHSFGKRYVSLRESVVFGWPL